MDPQIVAIAGTAGTAIVTAMATDSWERAREGVVTVWRRFRPEAADTVVQDFDSARDTLADALRDEDHQTESALVSAWQGHALSLLLAQPGAAEAIRELSDVLCAEAAREDRPRISLHASATGHGRIYQAGRDQQITER
ncbi:hypothetical protein ACIO3O_12790 [Streptomyces sp. NPDC087440]|uniref:hypothetical protein n=1 Tax=Streptomyces sp. NPDC087440 TaxID=3365790 RepID=UPI0038058021